MASQAVIAVVTEQDLIFQVPVRVILPVQTKMHGLNIARCRRNWFICVLIGLERMFKLECKQIIRDQEREIYLWCGKKQSAFALNMLSPSVDYVVPRNFSITDVVGHVPVPAGGLAAAGHLGHSLHRRLPVPLGALGDSLGHLLDLPDPACCRWHPDLLFLLLPLLIPSLNRLTLPHASLCILTVSGGRSASEQPGSLSEARTFSLTEIGPTGHKIWHSLPAFLWRFPEIHIDGLMQSYPPLWLKQKQQWMSLPQLFWQWRTRDMSLFNF